MKVAYTSLAPFVSGAERSLQVMLRSAPAAGIEPLLLCPPGTALIPWCEANHVPYVTVPLADRDRRHPLRWYWSVFQLARILRRERVEVVHSNQVWCFAAVGAAARLLGIPRVCHMRDEVGVEGIRWWCKGGVDAVICISQHIERLVTPAWSGARQSPRIETLLNPVMVTMTDAVSCTVENDCAHHTSARRRFGVDDCCVVFGFVGQIVQVKGVLELLDACRQLPVDQPWRLLIAGTDPHPGRPYEAECRRRVVEWGLSDRVTFLGFLDGVSDFYQAIDVAVIPSLEEPLGRIPLEAAVYARPSIAFATGGLMETVIDGRTGWLVRTGDVHALRDAMARALGSPEARATFGERARAEVMEKCDPHRYMRSLTALYGALIHTRHTTSQAESPEQRGNIAASSAAQGSTESSGSAK